MIKKCNRKLLALITAICVIFASVSAISFVFADDFVPQNLLRTDLLSATAVVKNISSGFAPMQVAMISRDSARAFFGFLANEYG